MQQKKIFNSEDINISSRIVHIITVVYWWVSLLFIYFSQEWLISVGLIRKAKQISTSQNLNTYDYVQNKHEM